MPAPSDPATASPPELFEPTHRFYDRLRQQDEDACKVSWRAAWDQEYRFEVLCEIFDRVAPAEPFSVLDVGCGLGDLAGFLRRRGDRCRYLGLDLLPEMVEQARRRYPAEQFAVVDLLRQEPPGAPYDFVLASGALSVRVAEHERFVSRMIARMLGLCTHGLAFNMQSARARSRTVLAQLQTDIYYADPLALYAECRKLTPRAVLREDFVTTDFAIFLFPGATRSHRGYAAYLAQQPPRPDAAVGMAYLYLEQKLPDEALAVLEQAEETAEVQNYRGLALLHLERPAEAIAPLRRSLALAPDQLHAPVNLGVALTMLGRIDEAIAVWQEALRRVPGNHGVRIKLSHALLAARRGQEAFDVAAGLDDASLRDNEQGLALVQLGRVAEGRALLERVAERNPSMAKVRFELGQLLEEQDDEPAAARRYLEALTHHAEHAGARKALRRMALKRRGQGRGAAAELRAAVAAFAGGGLEIVEGLLKELDR